MVCKSASERQVFLRSGRPEDGLGQLAIALVPPRGQLGVQAASAGRLIGRREHVLCMPAQRMSTIERLVPGDSVGSPRTYPQAGVAFSPG